MLETTTIETHQTSPFDRPSRIFSGIRFVLIGFDPIKQSQVSQKLVNGGGVNAGQYGPNCTHVIVHKLVYDDPVCVAVRRDGKILVSSLWVDHSFDVGAPVDTTSVMYRPVRDLNGIPGAKSLVICLTGYQREDREDIMTMVELMGAQFSKPLVANKVTHLICYKFEGEKYLLAKKVKRIKLINHRWLENCLKDWRIVPEADYSKSGYELEMEAEAKDSEDELEGVTARQNERKIASPPHSLLSNQEVPITVTETSATKVFNNQFPNHHEPKNKHPDTENVADVIYGTSNIYGQSVSSSSTQNKMISASTLANKSPQNEARNVISPMRTPSPSRDMKSNIIGRSSFVQKLNIETPNSGPAFCSKDAQNDSFSGKRKTGLFSGSFELLKMRQNNDALQELKDPPTEKSPLNMKSSSSKGKDVICDMPISKISTSETADLNAAQRPLKKYKETSFAGKFDDRDVGMVESVIQSPSAVSSDIYKKSSNQIMEINKQTGGSASKSVKRKLISKKFSGPNRTKKNTMNEKGSTFLKNSVARNDDEKNLEGSDLEVDNRLKIENMSWHKSLCMDDETEPPEDNDESTKEKHEDGEQENAVDVVMEEKPEDDLNDVDQNDDENDPMESLNVADKRDDIESRECEKTSKGNLTKNGKKKKEPLSDHDNKKPEVREESTPNRARRSKRSVNDADMDTVNADMETENAVNNIETKRTKRPLIKTKVPVKEVTKVQAVNKNPEKNLNKTSADVSKDEPMWFILAGHKLQRREFQQIIKRLKGRVCRVSHQWSYQATHFIVPDPVRRTEKFFAAAASGRWILKPDYLSASNQAGRFLPEELYEWHKNGLSEDGQINLEAPRKWRLLKEQTGHGAFYGMRIIIYGECIAPPLDTLKRVVKAGDGTILATSPPYSRFLTTSIDFAVVSPGMPHVDVWVQEFLKHEIPCVYADYLVEFVCKPGYPLERHVQYDTNVWAERSYNKLTKQLEEEVCEPRTPESDDVACEVCGSRDRGEEMLICGDESGLIGCGVGTHIDCCDPPFEDVPDEDWFCVKCRKKSRGKRSNKRKGFASRG